MKMPDKEFRLHLGCGKRFLPGFVHIDRDKYKHVDYVHDIKKLGMIRSGSASLVYCCHAFNYFDYDEAEAALREWCRVLKKGGILRLAVPGFEEVIRAYKKFGDIKLIRTLVLGRYLSKKGEMYHKSLYDFRLLKKMLEAAGFRYVKKYDWRKTAPKGYDDYAQAYLPHMDKEKGVLVSLNVEARK